MKSPKAQGNLKIVLDGFKDQERSQATAATALERIIKDGLEGNFQDFYCSHDLGMQERYLPATAHMKRESRFRASKAGECPQRQAYTAFFESDVVNPMDRVTETPAKWQRRNQLYTGTWLHLKWHVIFDYLHHCRTVKTLAAEKMLYSPELSLSGTIDRLISFTYCEQPRRVILDFKTIRPKAYELLGPTPADEYFKQMHAYFLLGFDCDGGMLLYENKGTQEILLVDIPRFEPEILALEDTYGMMNQWVNEMVAYHKTHDPAYGPKKRIKLPVLTDQCPGCPFKSACHNVEHPEILDEIRDGVVPDGVF